MAKSGLGDAHSLGSKYQTLSSSFEPSMSGFSTLPYRDSKEGRNIELKNAASPAIHQKARAFGQDVH